MSIVQELSNDNNDDSDLLKRVITFDEIWVKGFGVKIKPESSKRKRPEEPRPRKVGRN